MRMITAMHADRLHIINDEVLRRRLGLTIDHVANCLYRVQTVDESFAGLAARRNVTLIFNVKLPSLSYALPR